MSGEIQAVSAVSIPSAGVGSRALPLGTGTGTASPVAAAAPETAPAPSKPATAESAAPTRESAASHAEAERMRGMIQELERKLAAARTDLQFRIDDDLQELIVSVVKASDGSVVRQVPTEVQLRIARLLDQEPGGVIQTSA